MIVPNKITKQINQLPPDSRKRILDALSNYTDSNKKKLWFMGDNVSRVRCGKYRILVRDDRGQEPEVIYLGLRNDVYRRAKGVGAH